MWIVMGAGLEICVSPCADEIDATPSESTRVLTNIGLPMWKSAIVHLPENGSTHVFRAMFWNHISLPMRRNEARCRYGQSVDPGGHSSGGTWTRPQSGNGDGGGGPSVNWYEIA